MINIYKHMCKYWEWELMRMRDKRIKVKQLKVQTRYQVLILCICAHLSLIVGIPRNTTYIIHHNIHIHPFQHFNLYQIHNPSWHSYPSLTLVSRSDKQSNLTYVKFITLVSILFNIHIQPASTSNHNICIHPVTLTYINICSHPFTFVSIFNICIQIRTKIMTFLLGQARGRGLWTLLLTIFIKISNYSVISE